MKALSPENVLIRPFKTYKTHQYTTTYLGESNPEEIYVLEATDPPANWLWGSTSEPTNSGSLIYKHHLYTTLKQLFYPEVSLKYKHPIQYGSGSTILYDSGSWTFTGTGSIRRMPFHNSLWTFPSESTVYVLNVAQAAFGEQVKPLSFSVTTPGVTASIFDDGAGNLKLESNDEIVGSIFYGLGIAIVQQSSGSVINNDGMYLVSASELSVEYQSQHTIYEHTVLCTMERSEFNFSTNVSLQIFESSSISGSTKLFDAIQSGSLTPYFSTVGLYNDAGELMMIAKTPYPVRRLVESDQTVVVKFDI